MIATRYSNDILLSTTIEATDCATCGIRFGLDSAFVARRKADGRAFYCPNGDTLSWHTTDADRLKNRLAGLESTLTHTRDQLAAAQKSAASYKGVATRIKRRVAHGVCPCCQRTFQDVARHMAGQHPDFEKTI